MNTAKGQLRQTKRQCEFPGCTNSFVGPIQKKYCNDQRCIEARKILTQKARKPKQDKSVENLKLFKGKFPTGTMLNIQCSACGPAGRCQEKFIIVYEANRDIYPKYCKKQFIKISLQPVILSSYLTNSSNLNSSIFEYASKILSISTNLLFVFMII